MVLQSFHLGKTALIIFLEWLIKSRLSLLDVDMRYCCELKFEPEEAEQSCLLKMLVTRNRMVKVCLGNMGLSPPQLKIIFKVINEQRRLFSLDLSNINSQSMNRFGDETELLTKLLA